VSALARHVAKGTPRKYAAQAVGIAEVTLKKWVARGRAERSGIYVSLVSALKAAEGSFVASNVAVVKKAANGVKETVVKEATLLDRLGRPVLLVGPDDKPVMGSDGQPVAATKKETTTRKVFEWTAAAWLLERRAQDDFGANRNELRQLKELVTALTAKVEALTNAQHQGAGPAGQESAPQQPPNVGGDADPESI
jgi:hypothetical protein